MAASAPPGTLQSMPEFKRPRIAAASRGILGFVVIGALCFGTFLQPCVGQEKTEEVRKAISKPTPAYPAIAKEMALRGTVKMQIVIGPDGAVKGATVIGGHPLLVTAVMDTLKKWKYEPGPAASTTIIQFDFHP